MMPLGGGAEGSIKTVSELLKQYWYDNCVWLKKVHRLLTNLSKIVVWRRRRRRRRRRRNKKLGTVPTFQQSNVN